MIKISNSPQIRLGQVSTIDYDNGMISVQFPDLDGSVSNKMPMLSFNGEYKMPNVDDTVVVLNLSNGSSIGIILGTYWNMANRPVSSGKNVYRKEISNDTYIEYKNGTLVIHSPNIRFETDTGTTAY